jgi:tetrapyrrole methylase family protein/MazG family protein
MPKAPNDLTDFKALLQIVQTLRGPEGCPWDQEQTSLSLTPFAIEEVYELVEALEKGEPDDVKEELGDVLFQVALHAQLASEAKQFNMDDVITSLNQKMVRRHPHVFSDTQVKDVEEVWKNWEQIKKEEKSLKAQNIATADDPFSSLPKGLPALQTAYKIGLKTEKLKFDWQEVREVKAKVEEELGELNEILNSPDFAKNHLEKEAQTIKNLRHEIGDLLFSVAQLARHLDLEPEQSLREANDRFRLRFQEVLRLNRLNKADWDLLTLADKESLWQQAKANLQGF